MGRLPLSQHNNFDKNMPVSVIDNLASQINHVLDEFGFSDVSLNQENIVCLPNFTLLKRRIIDQYKEEWLNNLNYPIKLNYYKLFKNYLSFETDQYFSICNHEYRNVLCKFRVSALNLEIETGRYSRIAPNSNTSWVMIQNEVILIQRHS